MPPNGSFGSAPSRVSFGEAMPSIGHDSYGAMWRKLSGAITVRVVRTFLMMSGNLPVNP